MADSTVQIKMYCRQLKAFLDKTISKIGMLESFPPLQLPSAILAVENFCLCNSYT